MDWERIFPVGEKHRFMMFNRGTQEVAILEGGKLTVINSVDELSAMVGMVNLTRCQGSTEKLQSASSSAPSSQMFAPTENKDDVLALMHQIEDILKQVDSDSQYRFEHSAIG